MLNLELEKKVQLLERTFNLELDVEKVKEACENKEILFFNSTFEFFEYHTNLKNKSWGELYELFKEIMNLGNYSYDDKVIHTALKFYSLEEDEDTVLFDCLHRIDLENVRYLMLFIKPNVIEKCKKEKEVSKLVGRLDSDHPFMEIAYCEYTNCVYGDLNFNQFKEAIDDGSIVVFGNRKEFLDWYLSDINTYREIMDGLRNIKLDETYSNIDDYIINVVLFGRVTEFINCIMMDFELN